MKLLFIGGTGNISADCAALLYERGHEILVLSRGHTAVPPHYRAIRADRTDLAAMRAGLQAVQPDVVLNFLGYDLPEVQADYELARKSSASCPSSAAARPSARACANPCAGSASIRTSRTANRSWMR